MAKKPAKRKRMWVTDMGNGHLIVLKGPESAEAAKKQFAAAMNNPADADKNEFRELTPELLDELTEGPDFEQAEFEFSITPGGDC